MDEPAYVITLVHGTFAQNAEWARPGSEFANLLKDDIQESIIFRSFGWSGANSHDARLAAGKELVEHLKNSIAAFPNSKQLVIAHSHGGNLALHAQGCEGVKGKLAGIVTLGTPFLACKKRNTEASTDAAVATILVLLIAIAFLFFFVGSVYFVLNVLHADGIPTFVNLGRVCTSSASLA
jgi:hypothetical protein